MTTSFSLLLCQLNFPRALSLVTRFNSLRMTMTTKPVQHQRIIYQRFLIKGLNPHNDSYVIPVPKHSLSDTSWTHIPNRTIYLTNAPSQHVLTQASDIVITSHDTLHLRTRSRAWMSVSSIAQIRVANTRRDLARGFQGKTILRGMSKDARLARPWDLIFFQNV